MTEEAKTITSIQNVIDILESTEIQEASENSNESEKNANENINLEGNESNNDKQKSDTGKIKEKSKFLGFGQNQLQIDAGQKNFGITECKECGFNYNVRN